MSPLLVDWLSCAVSLLTLSLSVRGQPSRRCVRGSSRLLVGLVQSLCDRWRSTDRSRFHSVRSSGFGVAGGGFSDR